MTRSRAVTIAGMAAVAAMIGLALMMRRGTDPHGHTARLAAAPDIVLITIDTLRADRVGRGLTPAIDALAARGLRFAHARSPVPLTLPSHVSLMTGLLPVAHGVRENGMVFQAQHPTLARALRNAGYHTAAFVGAYVLDRQFGLSDGFDEYDDRVRRDPDSAGRLEAERNGAEVVDAALGWLQSARSPYFLWVHLYDPHVPYSPPAEYLARSRGNGYDGEVAYADAQVARIVSAVAPPPDERAGVIVVTGDHGEGLGEHDEQTHGLLAYDTTLRVPLVMAGPGVTRGVSDLPVSLIDVAPTLLRLAGLPAPESARGLDLLARLPADRDIYGETQYPRAAGWHPIAALAGERWKLVLSSEAELYDTRADPGERTSVTAAHPGIVHGMRARLRQMQPAAPPTSSAVDASVAERLRALGYVSGGPREPVDAHAPNPARVIGAWTTFEVALSQLNAGQPAAALPTLKDLTARFPSRIFESTYARALLEKGDASAAVTVYRRAVARYPGDAMLFHDLAVAARAAGARMEALRAEQASLALNKDNPSALNGLGLLHAEEGRPAEAAAAFARAADLDDGNASYWTNLGNARRELGDRAAAESAYRRALQADDGYANALNGLAVLFVQRGEPVEAIPLLKSALARAQDFHEARLNLGIAYQESGDHEKAAEAYRQLLATAPRTARRERRAAAELLKGISR